MSYTILQAKTPADLAILVDECIEAGMKPVGGLCVSSKVGGDIFYQAVSKIEIPKSENQISKTEIPNSKLENENSKIEKENLEFDFEDKKPVRKKRRKKSKVVRKKK